MKLYENYEPVCREVCMNEKTGGLTRAGNGKSVITIYEEEILQVFERASNTRMRIQKILSSAKWM